MAKISLSYPDTGLTISISVKNRDTGTEDFSGTMTEVGTTREYKYDFAEAVNTDYVYTATVTGYSPMSGVIYRVGGGLTVEQSEELSRIDSRVDQTISTIGSGILYNGNNYFDYTKISTLHDELKKAIRKEIKSIEIADTKEIIEELENIKTVVKAKDKTGEIVTISKLDQIEKKLDSQIKEAEIKKIDFNTETDKIVEILKQEDDKLKEIDTIIQALNKEEIKSIIKLLK